MCLCVCNRHTQRRGLNIFNNGSIVLTKIQIPLKKKERGKRGALKITDIDSFNPEISKGIQASIIHFDSL